MGNNQTESKPQPKLDSMPQKCPICGTTFSLKRYRLGQVYCSRKCVKIMHSNITVKEIAQYKRDHNLS